MYEVDKFMVIVLFFGVVVVGIVAVALVEGHKNRLNAYKDCIQDPRSRIEFCESLSKLGR